MLVVKYLNPKINDKPKAKTKAEIIDELADKWMALQEQKYFEKQKKLKC